MKYFRIFMPVDLHRQLKMKAADLGYTMNGLILEIIKKWLEGK